MITQFILYIIGAALIWTACGIKRKKESKIEIFSKWWDIQFVLISLGMLLCKLCLKLNL